MNELIAVVYPDEHRAGEVLATLRRLPVAQRIRLSHIIYVTKSRDATIGLHQITDLDPSGKASEDRMDSFWGPLMATLFLAPIADSVVGAKPAGGIEEAALAEWGIVEQFAQALGAAMVRNSSAIFVVARKSVAHNIVTGMNQFAGTVLRTPLSPTADARLLAHLEQQAVLAQQDLDD